MSQTEDAYGTQKCIAFVSAAIASRRPRRVLDIGCGTGRQLTLPVALAHPEVRFLGVDADARTIEYARATCMAPNLEFRMLDDLRAEERFDLVIASEVIEHVEQPVAFLRSLAGHMSEGGRVVLTVPNGYGPSELASLLETLLSHLRLLQLARAVKRAIWKPAGTAPVQRDTLAVSPHVNFFTRRALHRVIADAGFGIERFRSRILFCGFGFDFLVRGDGAARWNARVADCVPAQCVSGWMMVLVPVPQGGKGPEYRPGALGRLRRWLNTTRWEGA